MNSETPPPKSLEIERNRLAQERTQLAAERTFLSWLRTGLTSIGIGIALARFILFHTPEHQKIASLVGELLVVWGIIVFGFAFASFRRSYRKLAQNSLSSQPSTFSFIGLGVATFCLILLCSALFWILVAT